MRALLLASLMSCTEADIQDPALSEEPGEPVIDTGCGLAYQTPPDPAYIEAQFVAIPGSCIAKLDDPLMGPRCRSLMDKSLSGYFGEATRLEAIRVLGVQP